MKIVTNSKDFREEVGKLSKGEEILFYDRDINDYTSMREFQNFISRLMMLRRHLGLKITGVLSFKLDTQQEDSE